MSYKVGELMRRKRIGRYALSNTLYTRYINLRLDHGFDITNVMYLQSRLYVELSGHYWRNI